METTFYLLLALIIYTYLGYGIVITLLNLKKKKKQPNTNQEWPELTMVIAAYNEENYIANKIENTFGLDYPKDKLKVIVISDGSSDRTPLVAGKYDNVMVLHRDERGGKTAALNRAIHYVQTPLVFFSDANAMLNKEALKEMAKHFFNPTVGCVAGEKRVLNDEKYGSVGGGEGLYWKYESYLKKQDFDFHSAVGAAGELFALRTNLYEEQPTDTILDDFMLSLGVTQKGFIIAYEPNAYAQEAPSFNLTEELKRKVRIATGGLQSISRLPELMNFFKSPKLSFQYVSHRVLRWTITPLALVLLFPINMWLLQTGELFFQLTFAAQVAFYLLAFVGYEFSKRGRKLKLPYIAFYFLFMNYAVFPALYRFIKGNQSAKWERSVRADLAHS